MRKRTIEWLTTVSLVVAPMVAAGCGGEGPKDDPDKETPVWTSTSRRIEVDCFAFFEGSMRFAADREQLTTDQLELLSNLRMVEANLTCVQDVMGCSVTIQDVAGTSASYLSIDGDSTCSNPGPLISFASFDPFRRTLGCHHAKNLTYGADQTANLVVPDPRCWNGLFTPGDGITIPIRLGVNEAGRAHHVELDDCAAAGRVGKLSFQLFDQDGTTSLGTSAAPSDPGPDGTCAALDTVFAQVGTFHLQVVAAPGILPAGDFYLRFY